MLVKGSGVLLIQKMHKSKVLVLFKSKNNLYMELGGGKEDNETVYNNALRESREESYYSVNINKKDLIEAYKNNKYYDRIFNNSIYRCFYYTIPEEDVLTRKEYMKNKNIFKNLKKNNIEIPDYYFETNDISFFNIQSIYKELKNNDNTEYLTNNENKKCKIRDRTMHIIKDYISKL